MLKITGSEENNTVEQALQTTATAKETNTTPNGSSNDTEVLGLGAQDWLSGEFGALPKLEFRAPEKISQVESELASGTPLTESELQPLEAEDGLAIPKVNSQLLAFSTEQVTTSSNDIEASCSCMFCQPTQSGVNGKSSYSLDNLAALSASELLEAASPQNAVVPPSGDNQIDALLGGSSWDNPSTITYSFFETGSSYYGSETVSEVSDAIKNNVRTILETFIEPLINVNFVEVGDSTSSYGQMRYMFSNGPGYAYAYYPFSSTNPIAGDVHLSPNFEGDSTNRFSGNPGNHGYMSLIHETFHALGLKHPGNYNAGGGGTPGPYLPFFEDNTTNTVMTYNFTGNSAATAMPFDIKALQYIYGAKAYNTDSTTYSFSSVYGYTANGLSVGSPTTPMKLAIWDSGGTDTLDFSALASNASGYHFDLNQGGMNTSKTAYNGTTYTANGDTSGNTYQTSTNGTAIAYNVAIENAYGSSSNDDIFGNAYSNFIDGKAGNDNLYGQGGSDTLLGNSGNDFVSGGDGDDFLNGGSGNDVVDGLAGNDIVNGNLGNDTLLGYSGDDFMDGGEGNDTLNGESGFDTLNGGLGNDTYYVDNTDTINESSGAGTDTVVSSASYTLGANLENLTLTGSGAINGIGNTLANVITGNDANNLLDGAAGNDTLKGAKGVDFLKGNLGNDFVDGGAGDDKVIGGADSDVLVGGSGFDELTGALAADKFLYNTSRTFAAVDIGRDTITDFISGSDKIVLDKTTFKSLSSIVGAGFSIAEEFKVVATDAAAAISKGEIVYSKATDHLFYNQNGMAGGLGTGDLFATLTGVATMAATDFILQA